MAHYTSFTRITTLQLRLQSTETPRLATQCPTVPLSIQPASITVTHSGRHMERAAPVSALPSDTTHDFDAQSSSCHNHGTLVSQPLAVQPTVTQPPCNEYVQRTPHACMCTITIREGVGGGGVTVHMSQPRRTHLLLLWVLPAVHPPPNRCTTSIPHMCVRWKVRSGR